jgi:hypothetical protein
MSTVLFNDVDGLSERDRVVAELAARLALHTDVDPELVNSLGLGDDQLKQLKDAVSAFEKHLAQQSPTLTSLLASSLKSKCCS